MKYRDYKIGFTYEVPEYFSEVRESSFEVFNVAEGTIHYFILLDDEGDIVRNFSMSAEGPLKDNKEYEEKIKDYIDTLTGVDFVVLKENELVTEKGREIKRYVLFDKMMQAELGMLFYFTKIKDRLVVSTTYITEYYDEYEEELYEIFDSIEEM